MGVRWLDWSDETLGRARAEERPILLYVGAPWSAGCRRMDGDCWADETIAGIAEREYVAVRVDADRRPDLNRRFNMGGLPTTAFLTSEGDLLAGSGSLVPPERLRPLLERMAWVFRSDADSVQRAVGEHRKRDLQLAAGDAQPEDLSLGIPDDVVRAAREANDAEHGGFGRPPRRPLPLLLHFLADEVFWRRDGELGALLAETMGAMSFSPLWDDAAYGFFHAAAQADWTEPSGEKLVEDNALLLEAFVAAWRTLLDPSFRIVAEGLAAYLSERLAAPDGGFYSAELIDPVSGGDGDLDRTICVDRGAIGAHAFLATWVHFGREYRDFALLTLGRLWDEGWRDGRGFVHYLGQPEAGPAAPPPLLTDHVWALRAFCEAAQQTGEGVWLARARAVAGFMRSCFWDPEARAFRDTPGDGGRAEHVQRPLDENALAAAGLLELSALSASAEAAGLAGQVLAAGYDVYAQAGHMAASYAHAVSRYLRAPLEIELRVAPGSEAAERFVRGAYVRYHPWRVVRWRPGGEPAATAAWGEQRPPAARTPDELDALIGGLRPV